MKASELIKGKYYKFNYYGIEYQFKLYLKIRNKLFLDGSWYIRDGIYRNIEYLYDKESNFKEINFENIINLLPLDHPERIAFRKQRIKKILVV